MLSLESKEELKFRSLLRSLQPARRNSRGIIHSKTLKSNNHQGMEVMVGATLPNPEVRHFHHQAAITVLRVGDLLCLLKAEITTHHRVDLLNLLRTVGTLVNQEGHRCLLKTEITTHNQEDLLSKVETLLNLADHQCLLKMEAAPLPDSHLNPHKTVEAMVQLVDPLKDHKVLGETHPRALLIDLPAPRVGAALSLSNLMTSTIPRTRLRLSSSRIGLIA